MSGRAGSVESERVPLDDVPQRLLEVEGGTFGREGDVGRLGVRTVMLVPLCMYMLPRLLL